MQTKNELKIVWTKSVIRISGRKPNENSSRKLLCLEDDVGIPKKYLAKMAKIYHKQNMSELVSEIEEIEALLESVK